MSDFVSRDILPDLWEEILRRHWSFLETEESMQKLEERKKLEGCLKEFLCIVPHDRKFFLPETAHVLRKSVREMDDFSAYKAIIGFESISQYANNLFTKPWRKEFRVLKMYSGFFQHEIKSNLVDAEKLFEAMGYRRLSEEILILDGPICPDQVTNVSRDAMAAYVECQIMKHIYAGLISMGLSCSWQEVFHYREKHVGGTTQAIKALSYAIQDRRFRKEKLMSGENYYASIQQQQTPLVSQCSHCATAYHMQHPQYMQSKLPNGQCIVHSSSCALHGSAASTNLMHNGMGGSSSKLISSYPVGNYPQHPYATAHMPHSRSLEHYNEPAAAQLPQRLSFDQQQSCAAHHFQQPHVYESPYDCLDGVSMGSSASYAAVAAASNANGGTYAHPYNVSGNRYPLPYNISNQLNAHYATPSVTCNGVKHDASYGSGDHGYASVAKPRSCNYHPQQAPLPPTRHAASALAAKDLQALRQQRSFPPDHQLIDFDDRAPLTSHDFHAQLHSLSQQNSFEYERERMHDPRHERRSAAKRSSVSASYAQPRDLVFQHATPSEVTAAQLPLSQDVYDSYVYARPTPKSGRLKGGKDVNNMTDKYVRSMEIGQDCVDNNRKTQMELKGRGGVFINGGSGSKRKLSAHTNEHDTSDMSYESTIDDFVHVGHSERPQRSPTQAIKNQDGVGSFESWDYVFQNLEKSGYSKDLGERGDLLVQGLNLDALNLSSAAEKKRAYVGEARLPRVIVNGEKSRTLEKTTTTTADKRENKAKQEKSILKQSSSSSMANGGVVGKKVATKSALKPAMKSVTSINMTDNNGNSGNVSQKSAESSSIKRQMSNSARAQSSGAKHAPVATQVIVTSPNEWSCRFCTFLNPDTKRICEMCCRSKDFNLEASVSNTPTCV